MVTAQEVARSLTVDWKSKTAVKKRMCEKRIRRQMSFMKSGRLGQGKKSARPKRSAPTREWVGTINDLSVHRSTPAELSHRHEIHKSHNAAAAQWELKEKTLRGRLKQLGGSPAPTDPASLSIIREVFSDQLLLQDVLARSDRAMAVVKDLFGDAPRRHTGHPSVTLAPDCYSDSPLPVVQRADPPTQLALLSHSTMNPQALNELETSDEDHDEEETRPAAGAGARRRPRAELHKMKTRSAAGQGPQQLRAKPSPRHRGLGHSGPRTPCGPGPAPDPAALNATLAVRRVSGRTGHPEAGQGEGPEVQDSQVFHPPGLPTAAPCRQRKTRRPHAPQASGPLDGSAVSSLSQNQSSLDLLQAMLGQVEADLDSLGPQGPEREAPPAPRTQGLTGFSVALVSTLGRVVDLLRQREEAAQKEACERSRLEEEVLDQRGLIDALTAESLALREEGAALQRRISEQDQLLETVVLALGGLGGGLGPRDDPHTYPDPTHSPLTDFGSEWLSTELDSRLAQAPVSTAVLLSAPQQRDLLPPGPACPPGPDYLHPRQGDRARTPDPPGLSSSSSSTPLVTPDPERRPTLSEEALVAEIARLSQQNALIKAQLTQTRALGSALNTTSSSSSSSSSARSGGSGSVPGVCRAPAGRESRAQQALLTEDGPPASPEAAGSGASSGGSVERRLLELNRQSRAARGRLLELIEQQRRSVSPADSPVPPSAFSPHPAGGRTPESSVSLPDQEGSLGSGGKRLPAGSDCVPVRGPGSRDTSTLPAGPRGVRPGGNQGWFALSSHVGQSAEEGM